MREGDRATAMRILATHLTLLCAPSSPPAAALRSAQKKLLLLAPSRRIATNAGKFQRRWDHASDRREQEGLRFSARSRRQLVLQPRGEVRPGSQLAAGAADGARGPEEEDEGSKAAQLEVPVTIQVSEELGQLEPMGPDSDVKDGVKVEKSMWSKLGQRVNVAGIQFASRIMLWDQHLAIPHVSVPDIRWIDWKALRDRGFEGVVFDKDNTITAPYALAVWPALAKSLQECQSVFEGRIALLSNSAGLYQFDPNGVEAQALEERLGIPVIRHGTKKPAGTAEDISKHFGCEPSRLIMVGDRYFTDVVYGNNNGLLTIRPTPLTSIGEPFVVRKVRMLEEALVGRWVRQKVQPKEHALFTTPHDYIKDPACW